MDTNYLEHCVAKIKVRNLVNEDVEIVNNSPLEMIGKGRQGAVFKVTEDICVKVFGNTEDCDREHYALSLGQHTNLFPKVYHKGSLHIAMEIIRGVDLREYLQSQPLTRGLSIKLIEMLITFKEIGYERIDHHKRQIYLQEDGSLKVIDVARTVWRDRVYPYPRKLLNSLGDENKEVFLSHVEELSPTLYGEWRHYIRMEEIAGGIYQVLLESEGNKNDDMVKILSDKLLTTQDEDRYVVLMAGLMHKVFKEQWVRTMLARGVDLNKVTEKIDEFWDARKLEYKQMVESNNSINETDSPYEKDSDKKKGDNAKAGRAKKTWKELAEEKERKARNQSGREKSQEKDEGSKKKRKADEKKRKSEKDLKNSKKRKKK